MGFTVEATNATGAVLTGYRGTVHFTSTDPQAVFPGNYTYTAADGGVHTFTATFKTAGTQGLTATDTSGAIATATVSGMAVQPGAVSRFAITAPVSAAAGSEFSISVAAFDAYNNPATNYRGTVSFTSLDPGAVLPANYTFASADSGAHSFIGLILKTVANETITATDTESSAAGTASIAVLPVLRVQGFPTTVTAGVPGSFTVTAVDGFDNTVTGYLATVDFATSDAKGIMPGSYTFTAADRGVHTFTATLETAGPQSITARDAANPATTGTARAITVNPAAACQITLTPSAGGVTNPGVSGTAFVVEATVTDAYGNVVTGYTGTVHFTSSDSKAVLPANYTFLPGDRGAHSFLVTLITAGSQSITVFDTSNSSISGSVTGMSVLPARALLSATRLLRLAQRSS
jgi:hypothetical protein